ncbi:MAG: fructosamine kinase family protein [Egibacteraceae bacterium]
MSYTRLPDGREAVVKRTTYPAEIEAEGLRALAEAGAPVPEIFSVSEHALVLERVGGPPAWEALGTALAGMHRGEGEAQSRYGWHRDNRIGPLEQPNRWHDNWPAFFAQCRIRPHLADLPTELRRRIEVALDGLGDLLPAHPHPSLVHGDLWSGNVVGGRWLIDPAVAYCDREYELAFMALFGGLPTALWAAYEEAWPLQDGWQHRRPALQLPHLLVHVRLFGSSYLPAVADRLDQLGW